MNPMLKKKTSEGAHCHIMVAKVAQGMARELYATWMQSNPAYAEWKEANPGLEGEALEDRWVATRWGRFLEAARATLAGMLRQSIDDDLKKQIFEALMLDATLTRGRPARAAQRLNGAKTNA